MDILDKRTGLKGLFSKKEDRKLLYFYHYHLNSEPVSVEYISSLLELEKKALERKISFLEEMGMLVRDRTDRAKFVFIPMSEQILADMLEEFMNSWRGDYEKMSGVFLQEEIKSFLNADYKGND